MVVDTSALLAILLGESVAPWIRDVLQAARAPILMSSINYAETLIICGDRRIGSIDEIRVAIADSRIEIVGPSSMEAEIAAKARLSYPLNLGDCFAYALAKRHDLPLLTLDRDFRKCDLKLLFPRIQ